MASVLSIGTLNTHGSADDRMMYLNKAMKQHEFMMVQEHWLLSEQLSTFQSSVENVCVHGISGMSDSTLLHGRPYGGCAILWRKDLNCSVSPIQMETKHACGVAVSMNDVNFLLICVYMPTDSGNTNVDAYNETLSHISAAMNKCNINRVIIGGDFNADLSRLY